MRFRKHAAPFLKSFNTLAQDPAGGSAVLRELEALDDQTLRGVAECSRINLRRLLRRSVLGWGPTVAAGAGALVALPKAIKDVIGLDVLANLSSAAPSLLTPVAIGTAVGFALGGVGSLVVLSPKLGFARAVDDLIAIAAAHRGGPR